MAAVNIKGLDKKGRGTSINELNARLADSLALGLAIKQAHWNVKGPNFIAVHELFDTVYERLQEHVDVMAERIQILDGTAVGTVEKVAAATTLKEYPTDLIKAQDHIKALCERMRVHGDKLRDAIGKTDQAGDADTADIFTAASRTADKDLWFMESHLE